jgi:DNA-binding winged helix-turn-helix (wHTH) protein
MPSQLSTPATLRIGAFCFDPATGELDGPDGRRRLRRQSARALELLASDPGRLFTREELRTALWGETWVDFGQGLHDCVNEIRVALGDSAREPRYVETLPRRGYRLIAAVEPIVVVPAVPDPVALDTSQRLRTLARTSAGALSLALLAALSTASGPARSDVPPLRPELDPASILVLRGRHALAERTPESLQRAANLFERARAASPLAGAPWAGLADAHRLLAEYAPAADVDHVRLGHDAARRAVELAPNLSAAHTALAAHRADARDFAGAERAYLRAIELEPRDAAARLWYSDLLRLQGRLDEALAQAHAARRFDPLSAMACAAIGKAHLLAARPEAAQVAFEEALTIEPALAAGHLGLAQSRALAGRPDEALRLLERAPLPASITDGPRGYLLARTGRTTEARAVLERLQAAERDYDAAVLLATLGERESALRWLERAVLRHDARARALPNDTRFRPLESDPRFEALLARYSAPANAEHGS